jgi:plastocyanin
VIVYYTTNGFSPTQVEVKTGENVRFINKQGNSMRVVPGADYPGGNQAPFNQESSLGYNKSYEFTASKAGVWIFMNLNNPKHTGTLIVR